MEGQAGTPRLLDQVRNVLRLHHYSIHTERSYVDWFKRYVHFHRMRCQEDLVDGEKKIEAFLTDLAARGADSQHRTSNIEHPTSNIQHRTSNIEHPTSNIQHREAGGLH